MSKIVRINDGDYKLSVRDSSGNLTLTTFEKSLTSDSNIKLLSKDIVINGISGQSTNVSTENLSVNLFNDVATTINAFGAATTIDIGNSSGTITIHNASTILDGDLQVKGGDITSLSSPFNLLNQATTVDAFQGANTINIGPSITHIIDTVSYTEPLLKLFKQDANNAIISIHGDLVVYGSRTEVNSSTITVDDINIELGKVATPTDISANTGGIILKGATDKTITWANDGNTSWTSSENWNVSTGKNYKINNVTVVTSSELLPNATTIEIGTTGGSTTIHNDSLILDGDLQVNGGDIITDQSTFNILNNIATTINAFGSATTVNAGANGVGGLFTINNETTKVNNLLLDGTSLDSTVSTFDLLNTPTTITAFESATSIGLGSTSGVLTIHNPSTVLNGDLTIDGGSDNICTVSTIATTTGVSLFSQYAEIVNAFDSATDISIGASTGTLTIKNATTILDGDLEVNGGDLITDQSSFNLINSTATLVNAFGDASTISIGASTGTLTIKNATTVLDGDLNINGGDLITGQSSFDLINTTATTINAFGNASTINIGSTSGTLTINNTDTIIKGNLEVDGDAIIQGGVDGICTISSGTLTTGLNLFTQYVSSVSAFGAASNITFNQLSLTSGNLKLSGTGTLNVASGTIISDSSSVNVFTDASMINIGSDNGGTTNLNSTFTNLKTANIENLNVSIGMSYAGNQLVLNNITSPTDITASDGGIILKGTTDKTFKWSSNNWNSSENINLSPGRDYKINTLTVLDSTNVLPNATTANIGSAATTVNINGELHVNKILVDGQFATDYTQYDTVGIPAEAVVTTYSAAVYRSAKYYIEINSADGVHACEISVLQRNGQVSMVQYLDHYLGDIPDDSNGTFDVRYNNITDMVELVLTPLKANLHLHIAMTLVKV